MPHGSNGNFTVEPVTLTGSVAALAPLRAEHAADLFTVGRNPAIWTHLSRRAFMDVGDATRWIEAAISQASTSGTEIPFAIIHRPTGRAVGSTRYMDIRREHRGLEIGWTWISPEHQRTALNTECKLLLLGHAFDTLGAVRVQLKTDILNLRSQAAIERIGAKREGVLRKHMLRPDGSWRDSVYFSITDDEWPAVRERLQLKLASIQN